MNKILKLIQYMLICESPGGFERIDKPLWKYIDFSRNREISFRTILSRDLFDQLAWDQDLIRKRDKYKW